MEILLIGIALWIAAILWLPGQAAERAAPREHGWSPESRSAPWPSSSYFVWALGRPVAIRSRRVPRVQGERLVDGMIESGKLPADFRRRPVREQSKLAEEAYALRVRYIDSGYLPKDYEDFVGRRQAQLFKEAQALKLGQGNGGRTSGQSG